MKDYMKIYREWLSNPYFDEDTKAELKAIEHDENEIKERFYMDLEFGTAGLRWHYRCWYQPHEHLCGAPRNPGPGKLYHQAGRKQQGRSHRVRFQTYVSGVRG